MLTLHSDLGRNVYLWKVKAHDILLRPLEEAFLLKSRRQLSHVCDWNGALANTFDAHVRMSYISHLSVTKNSHFIVGTLSEAADSH